MHYYKRNIGDYAKKTGRLSILEHGAYTLLIDACYDRERFPTEAEAIEWVWARSEEEVSAVKFVLERFFDFDGAAYVQSRIREELATYHETSATNKRIAHEREEKRRNREHGVNESSPSVHEAPPNHKPLTKNHKPRTTNQPSDEGFEAVYQAYPKKVGKPAALKAWNAAKVTPEQVTLILKDIAKRKVGYEWTKDGGQFIPNPSTYINQRRWEDAPVAVVSNIMRGVI